ncbi:MAG: hypothetical protein Q9179_007902, partial [Wetmoreana sp. 5 TL-2023]
QAYEFLRVANVSTAYASNPTLEHRNLCVGIATVERPHEQYIRLSIGSLLDGLAADERAQIHLIVLVAHTDPFRHPIYQEPWLQSLSDEVLTYNSTAEYFNELRGMEENRDYRKKAVFDYTYLMEACINSRAAWIAMIEDDTLAVKNWYNRVLQALDDVDSQSSSWLYLRLFFTEEYFGWNREFWLSYLAFSILTVISVATTLLLLRKLGYRLLLSTVLIISLVYTPACIVLYFLAGKVSLRPFTSGVHEMPNYGCCAQGLVFRSTTAARVVAQLKDQVGYVDMILEAWADRQRLTRFAVVPSLLQHIGGRSSKGDDFATAGTLSAPERIFNFGFELYQQVGNSVVHPLEN